MQLIEKSEAYAAVMEALSVQVEKDRVPDVAEIKVKSNSEAADLAGSILNKCKECGHAKLRAIGNTAIGVATRAATIASNHMHTQGLEMVMRGFFWEIKVDGDSSKQDETGRRTGYTLVLEPR